MSESASTAVTAAGAPGRAARPAHELPPSALTCTDPSALSA